MHNKKTSQEDSIVNQTKQTIHVNSLPVVIHINILLLLNKTKKHSSFMAPDKFSGRLSSFYTDLNYILNY